MYVKKLNNEYLISDIWEKKRKAIRRTNNNTWFNDLMCMMYPFYCSIDANEYSIYYRKWTVSIIQESD